MQASPEFGELRSKFRSFAFPMTVAFFVWYIVYVLVATFASEWMATPVFGTINIGLIFGLLQFVTTFAITYIYIIFANKNLEPRQVAIRKKMEG
ncbi:DUF485 domain-containing protein [Corynebacterium crudilactis]|uniref:Clumping factor B n=1 Tax=Corynebacterium crudilactis TaxID=1652495 RepID=A0A172QS05_9CORY|nr:DUF485 domain-containing protein [Corynebacterium crudilactis]ANE03476.1 hypothetical protein ccrud_04100 [Corynebacterium crudilactis]